MLGLLDEQWFEKINNAFWLPQNEVISSFFFLKQIES